ncbi:hypothetical protein GCM10007874_45760 [Labrys miyagiensis]|uniref:Uncharacterized protein n=1 Tax=Labrys miyagiensis TaxID=346912 RepID=A0ABQ6CPA6_9HYPH|nr:hypothetical protein GCM10007874_45760 [Labrys miyagiensis]
MDLPSFLMNPTRVFELVLDVEEPHSDRSCDQHYRYLDEKKRLEAHELRHQGNEYRNREIRSHRTDPWLTANAHKTARQAVPN